LILNHFLSDQPFRNLFSARKRIKPVSKLCSLNLDLIKTLRFVGPSIDLLEGLAFHLELHLQILLEHFRIALAKPLGHPLVRHAAGAEPSSVRRAEIVNPESTEYSYASGSCDRQS